MIRFSGIAVLGFTWSLIHQRAQAQNHVFSNIAPAVASCVTDSDCPAGQNCCKFGCGSCVLNTDEILTCPSLSSGPGVPGGQCATLCHGNAVCPSGQRCCSDGCVRRCLPSGPVCSSHSQCKDGERCCKNACGQSCQKCYPGTHFPCPVSTTVHTSVTSTPAQTIKEISRSVRSTTIPNPSGGERMEVVWLVLIVCGSLVTIICTVSMSAVLIRRSCSAKISCGSDEVDVRHQQERSSPRQRDLPGHQQHGTAHVQTPLPPPPYYPEDEPPPYHHITQYGYPYEKQRSSSMVISLHK